MADVRPQLVAAARRLAAEYFAGADPRDVELADSIAKLNGVTDSDAGLVFDFEIDEVPIFIELNGEVK